MIVYVKGNLFDSPAQILVNAVNTKGVMGKGIALEFKKRYPKMFDVYQKKCEDKTFGIGKLLIWRGENKQILLFPTKDDWKQPSKLDYIEAGLKNFKKNWSKIGVTSVAFPKLGCGNGGLPWEQVQPLMEKYLKDIPPTIYIYADNLTTEKPEHQNITEIEKWIYQDLEHLSFACLKDKIINDVMPKGVLVDGHRLNIKWESATVTFVNAKTIQASEEDLQSLWDYIRRSAIFESKKLPAEYQEFSEYFLAVLNSIEYLQPVILSKNKEFDSAANGYQVLER